MSPILSSVPPILPSLPLAGGAGTLVPVGEEHADDDELIATLALWRVQNMAVYPTRFPVSLEGTASWLRDRVLAVPSRVMWLVEAPDGERIGHGGLARIDELAAKLDNVMRGVPKRTPGIMEAAVNAILDWAHSELPAEAVYAPVFTWNVRALAFFRRLGFRDDRLLPLTRVENGERIEHVPYDPACGRPPDDYHLRLVYALADREPDS